MYKSLRQKRQKDKHNLSVENVSVLFGHLIKHCKINIFFFIRLCKIFYFFPSPTGPWQRRRFRSEVWWEDVHIWILIKRCFLQFLDRLKKKKKVKMNYYSLHSTYIWKILQIMRLLKSEFKRWLKYTTSYLILFPLYKNKSNNQPPGSLLPFLNIYIAKHMQCRDNKNFL